MRWSCAAFLLLVAVVQAQPDAVDLDKPLVGGSAHRSPRTSLRIATWNIHHGTHLDEIARELSRDPCDVCLLQEADEGTQRAGNADIAAQLAVRLGTTYAYGIEFEELGQESGTGRAYTGQGTLSRLPISHVRVLRFHEQSGFWQPHRWLPTSLPMMQRRLGGRMALVTEIKLGATPVLIYNAHLESRSLGRIQSVQIDEMLADLQRYSPHTAAVIAGDLNTKYFPSSFLHKLEHEGFQNATGDQLSRTHRFPVTLDWIFVRGPIALEQGEVRHEARGSDHYPLYVTLKLKN